MNIFRRSPYILLTTLFLWIVAFSSPIQAEESLDVHLLTSGPVNDDHYSFKLLHLALSSQDIPFTLTRGAVEASQPRRVDIVAHSPKKYVVVLGSSPKIEKTLNAIYVPTHLGLGLGKRVMLARRDRGDVLKSASSIDDLRPYTFGVGIGWSEIPIYYNAGLRIVTAPTKKHLVRMLKAGRLDFFPRGISEIIHDRDRAREVSDDIIVESHILLSYPIASFFFVNKDNKRLHDAIEEGMIKAYESGELQALMQENASFTAALKECNIAGRRVVTIPNEDSTEETRRALELLTYSPQESEAVLPTP